MVLRWVLYPGAAISGVYYVLGQYVSVSKVIGESMYPTLNPHRGRNDWVIADERVKRNYSSIRHGDVVVFRSTRDPDEYNVKRIVGLEGDTVSTLGYKNKYVKIPPGHCWLEGDNSSNSDDSNRTGPTPMGLILSKAKYIVTRFEAIEPKFPHSRVILNPNLNIDALHRVHKLPPLNFDHVKKHPHKSKIHINVNAAESDN